MTEDLDDDDKPTVKEGFSDTWLIRRRTWDEKARNLRVYLTFADVVTYSSLRLLRAIVKFSGIHEQ
jgi:hypothetical protein